ncbi:MAG: BCCT family transporter [Bacillota bacterium]|nr:BCCT family transporter [Bacillota bacterium]
MKKKDSIIKNIDWIAVAFGIALLLTFFGFTMAMPEKMTSGLDTASNFVTGNLGFYFVLLAIVVLIYNCWLIFSKYGEIRLGKEKPMYSYFGWLSMIFCAAMGATILYWSSIEWVYYVTAPPMGLEAESQEAYDIAVAYSFFHWGIPAWSIYAVGAIPFAYRHFLRKKEGLNLQHACEGVLGKRTDGLLGEVISIIFVFGTLGGLVMSFGAGIPMIRNNLHNLVGTPETFMMTFILVICVTAVFTWSAVSGIGKGIQVLSKLTAYICLVLVGIFLIFGHGIFALDNTVQSIGTMIDNFIPMLFYLDPIGQSGFPQDWTIFYWAWWIGLAPVMWIFIAKISSGRKIRDVIITVMVAGTAGSILFFGVISNYGIYEQLFGSLDIISILSNNSAEQAISSIVSSLPGGMIVLTLWMITSFILMVTTMDSASFTLGASTMKQLGVHKDPPTPYRVFWAAAVTIIPLCLLYANANINIFKSVLIISAIPVSICILMAVISCTKWLFEDYGKKTRAEIIEEFSLKKNESPDVIVETKNDAILNAQQLEEK